MVSMTFLIKLAAFTLAILPLLIENLSAQTASNRSNAILFMGGLAFVAWELATGAIQPSFGLFGGFALIIIGALAFAISGIVSGGVAKTLAALAPWLGLGDFLVAFTVAMLAVALIGHLRRKTVGIAAPLYLATATTWIVGPGLLLSTR